MATKSVLMKDGVDFILPITNSKSIYLDNDKNRLSDIVNNKAILTGGMEDKLLIIYHNNLSSISIKKYKYRIMGVYKDNNIFSADIFVTSIGGSNVYLSTNNINNTILPSIKVVDRCIVIDVNNLKEFSIYNEYYDKCMYDKYDTNDNIIIDVYDSVMISTPNILPSHVDYSDFVNNILPEYEEISGDIVFNYATLEDIDIMFGSPGISPGPDDGGLPAGYEEATDSDIEDLFIKAQKLADEQGISITDALHILTSINDQQK